MKKASSRYSWNPFSSRVQDQVLNSPARDRLNRWGDANVAAGQPLHLYFFPIPFCFTFFTPPFFFPKYIGFLGTVPSPPPPQASLLLSELCRFEKQGPYTISINCMGIPWGGLLSNDSARSCLANEFFPAYRPTHLSRCFLISLRLCIRSHQAYWESCWGLQVPSCSAEISFQSAPHEGFESVWHPKILEAGGSFLYPCCTHLSGIWSSFVKRIWGFFPFCGRDHNAIHSVFVLFVPLYFLQIISSFL